MEEEKREVTEGQNQERHTGISRKFPCYSWFGGVVHW